MARKSQRQKMLDELKEDIAYFKKYKFGLYAFIMQNYASLKHSDKIPPDNIIMIFKEITLIDQHIDKLYRIVRSHDP